MKVAGLSFHLKAVVHIHAVHANFQKYSTVILLPVLCNYFILILIIEVNSIWTRGCYCSKQTELLKR